MIGQLGGRRGARLDRRRIAAAPPPTGTPPFMSTPTRFSSIARSIAAAETGKQALRIGDADHEQIGRDGIAEQRGGQAAPSTMVAPAPATFWIARLSASAGRLKSASRVKSPVIISCALTTAALPGRQRDQRLAGDHQIAAEQQLRAAGRDAHRLDGPGAARCADGSDGAALLGEAGHLEHGSALALEMPPCRAAGRW